MCDTAVGEIRAVGMGGYGLVQVCDRSFHIICCLLELLVGTQPFLKACQKLSSIVEIEEGLYTSCICGIFSDV